MNCSTINHNEVKKCSEKVQQSSTNTNYTITTHIQSVH